MATRTISNAGGNWNATGTWVEGAVPTSADDVVATATSGNLTVNATANCKSLVLTGYNAASAVTHNTGINLTVAGNVTLTAGQYTAASDTAKITITGSAATLTTAGCLLGSLTINRSGGTVTLGDHLSFMASAGCVLTIQAGTLDLNGKTLSGNSAVNRLLVQSNTVGTAATVTVSSGSFANADFMDISFANGGANLDLSAITGLSGDCGGNTMSGGGTLTLTTARVCNWANANGGNWGDVANWDTDGATDRVPLPQDDVTFSCAFNTGKTVTVDLSRLSADIDWSSATWTGTAPTWRWAIDAIMYGSLAMLSGVTLSTGGNTRIRLCGRGAHTLLTCSQDLRLVYIEGGGTYTLLDAIYASYTLTVTRGGLVSDGYTVTGDNGIVCVGSATCTIDWSGSDVILTGAGSTLYGYKLTNTNLTLTAVGTTVRLTYTGASTTYFAGGTHSHGDIVISPASGVLLFSGNFSFGNMSMASAGSRTVQFTGGSSVTMTGDTFLGGTSGAPITITSSDTNQFTLSKSSEGYVSSDYLNIDYCTVDSASKWYAGANSVDGGHNGTPTWTFSTPYIEVTCSGAIAAGGSSSGTVTAPVAIGGGIATGGSSSCAVMCPLALSGAIAAGGSSSGTIPLWEMRRTELVIDTRPDTLVIDARPTVLIID